MNARFQDMILLYIVLTGLCIASFIGSLAFRVPRGISILHPPSFCPACGNRIKPYDLVPVISYLLLKGRCRECGSRIPLRFLLLEIGVPLIYAAIYYRVGLSITFYTRCYLMTLLVYLALIDIDTGEIGIWDIIPVYLGGIAILIFSSLGMLPFGILHYLSGSFAASALLAAGFSITYLLKRRIPLGKGDLFLVPGVSLYFGLIEAIRVMMFSSVTGTLFGLVWIMKGRVEKHSGIPLLPFLAAGVMIEIFLFSC